MWDLKNSTLKFLIIIFVVLLWNFFNLKKTKLTKSDEKVQKIKVDVTLVMIALYWVFNWNLRTTRYKYFDIYIKSAQV